MSQFANSFYKTNLALIFQNKTEDLRWLLKKDAGVKSPCLWNAARCETKCENTFHLGSRMCMLGLLMKCLLKDLSFQNDQLMVKQSIPEIQCRI